MKNKILILRRQLWFREVFICLFWFFFFKENSIIIVNTLKRTVFFRHRVTSSVCIDESTQTDKAMQHQNILYRTTLYIFEENT